MSAYTRWRDGMMNRRPPVPPPPPVAQPAAGVPAPEPPKPAPPPPHDPMILATLLDGLEQGDVSRVREFLKPAAKVDRDVLAHHLPQETAAAANQAWAVQAPNRASSVIQYLSTDDTIFGSILPPASP